MAENKRGSIEDKTIGEISIKVDVDVSEALTGLKSVERQAKAAARSIRELERESGKVSAVNDMRDIQGQEGNFDVSDYMCGLYNGLELASATMENRDPEFKTYKEDETESITRDISRSYE